MFDVTPDIRPARLDLLAVARADAARMRADFRASGRSSGYGDLDRAGGVEFPAQCMARDDADGFAWAALDGWERIATHRDLCRSLLRDPTGDGLAGFPEAWRNYRRAMAIWGDYCRRYRAALWAAGRLSLPRVAAPVDPMTLPGFRAVVLGEAA